MISTNAKSRAAALCPSSGFQRLNRMTSTTFASLTLHILSYHHEHMGCHSSSAAELKTCKVFFGCLGEPQMQSAVAWLVSSNKDTSEAQTQDIRRASARPLPIYKMVLAAMPAGQIPVNKHAWLRDTLCGTRCCSYAEHYELGRQLTVTGHP